MSALGDLTAYLADLSLHPRTERYLLRYLPPDSMAKPPGKPRGYIRYGEPHQRMPQSSFIPQVQFSQNVLDCGELKIAQQTPQSRFTLIQIIVMPEP